MPGVMRKRSKEPTIQSNHSQNLGTKCKVSGQYCTCRMNEDLRLWSKAALPSTVDFAISVSVDAGLGRKFWDGVWSCWHSRGWFLMRGYK